MESEKSNLVLDLTFSFSKDIIEFTEQLEDIKKFSLAKQLFRSGTSIGANIREAQSAESKIDFIHKIKIAAKEAEETEYWLLLCKDCKNYPFNESILEKLIYIKKVLSKIISSAKNSI